MVGKWKIWVLSVMVIAIGTSVPKVYGAAQELKATVWRYQGDLGGWSGFGPIKTEKEYAIVPLRKYIDLLGLPTEYDTKTKQVVIQSVKTRLVLKPGSRNATVNGKTRVMPLPLKSVNGTMWIPLDFIRQVFPAQVIKYKSGYEIRLQESYVIRQFGGEWFILHDQTGDLYLSPKGKYAPIKIASLDRKLNSPKFTVEKTENGNYYVSVSEFMGDGAIHSTESYSSLYIYKNKERYQNMSVNAGHNRIHRYHWQVVFVKGNEVLFIDDRTGETVRTAPFKGGGLVDIQGDVWVTQWESYGLYFPKTGEFINVYDLLENKKDQAEEWGQVTCPVSPRCGGYIAYHGREGDELIFSFKGKRFSYKLPGASTAWRPGTGASYAQQETPFDVGLSMDFDYGQTVKSGSTLTFTAMITNSTSKPLKIVKADFEMSIGPVTHHFPTLEQTVIPGKNGAMLISKSWKASLPPGEYVVELKTPVSVQYEEDGELKTVAAGTGVFTNAMFPIRIE